MKVMKFINFLVLGSIFYSGLGIAQSEEMTEQKNSLFVHFQADSMGEGAKQVITIFPKSLTDYYCQQDDTTKGKSVVIERVGDKASVEIGNDTVFCVKVEDYYQENRSIDLYYGPYMSSTECSNKTFKTRNLGHLYAPNECLAPLQEESYKTVIFKGEGNPSSSWIITYDLRLLERGTSKICDINRGDMFHLNPVLVSDPYHGSSSLDNYVAISDTTDFCISIDHSDSDSTYVKAGPFSAKSNESGKVCELLYREDINGKREGIYANEHCTSDEMIAFKNIKYINGTESLTTVEIHNAGDSNDCAKNTADGRLETFKFWPEQLQNFNISHVTDSNKKICLKVTGGTDIETTYTGPFYAKPGCKFEIGYQNVVTPSATCIQ